MPQCKYDGKPITIGSGQMTEAFALGVEYYKPSYRRCRFQEEGGITQHSLFNLVKLKRMFPDNKVIKVERGLNGTILVEFSNMLNFVATGFGVGYGGEGPNGFATFLSEAGFGDKQGILSKLAALPMEFKGSILAVIK